MIGCTAIALFTGCGQKETVSDSKQEEKEVIEETASDTEEMESEEIESENVDTDTEEPPVSWGDSKPTEDDMMDAMTTWAEHKFSDSYYWYTTDEETNTFVCNAVFATGEDSRDYITHIDSDYYNMDVVWSGSAEFEDNFAIDDIEDLVLFWIPGDNPDEIERAFALYFVADISGGTATDYENTDITVQEWALMFPGPLTYVEGGYSDLKTTDSSAIGILEGEDEEYKGYTCYIMDEESGIIGKYCYLEKKDIYDDSRARSAIESVNMASRVIKDYTPVSREDMEE